MPMTLEELQDFYIKNPEFQKTTPEKLYAVLATSNNIADFYVAADKGISRAEAKRAARDKAVNLLEAGLKVVKTGAPRLGHEKHKGKNDVGQRDESIEFILYYPLRIIIKIHDGGRTTAVHPPIYWDNGRVRQHTVKLFETAVLNEKTCPQLIDLIAEMAKTKGLDRPRLHTVLLAKLSRSKALTA